MVLISMVARHAQQAACNDSHNAQRMRAPPQATSVTPAAPAAPAAAATTVVVVVTAVDVALQASGDKPVGRAR